MTHPTLYLDNKQSYKGTMVIRQVQIVIYFTRQGDAYVIIFHNITITIHKRT